MRRLLCLLLACLPLPAAADNLLGMSYVETKDLRLVWFDPLGYLSPHAIRTFTNSLEWQRRMFGWTPSEAVTVLFKDFSDFGSVAASASPRNRLFFDIGPLSRAFETYPASERMFGWMNHEMVHVATFDVANDDDRRWRRLFGGKVSPQAANPESLLYSFLTVPRFIAPRWYVEGSAVFMDTWMAGGLGRAQGGYDEMVFRSMVRDGLPLLDPLALESRGTRDFNSGANAYLYGTRFMTWLAYTETPAKVVEWLRRDAGSRRYYAKSFEQTFGMPLDEAWRRWVAFEHEFQRGNLAEVRKFPITSQKTLVSEPLGSVSRMFFDERTGKLYAAFRYPGFIEHVGEIDTRDGSRRRLADIRGAMLFRVASLAYDAGSGTLFYTNDNLEMRDLMALDVRTGETRMLFENARIGDLALNPVDRALWGVRLGEGFATLVRIPHPYTRWEPVYTFDYEFVPSDLDVSPDGRLLSATISEANGDQYLRVWEIDKVLKEDFTPVSEFRFGQSVPENFTFSRDGRYLYGSSYYTGVSNIFRYEVATGKVDAVTNAETGYFRPVPLTDGRLVVLGYTGAGFVPAIIDPKPIEDVSAIRFLGAQLAARHPVVTTWQVPSPAAVDDEKLVVARGDYQPLRRIGFANAYPVLQGYKDSIGVGYRARFEDPLSFATIDVTAAYTPDDKLPSDERGHVDILARYLGFRAGLSWNHSDFYDLFGPTKRARKGYAATFGYDQFLILDDPRRLQLVTDLAFYDKLDTIPAAQNVAATFERLFTAEAGLHFTDVRRSIGAVDDEKGWTWEAVATYYRVPGESVSQVRGRLDYGFDLPLPNSSLWLRTAAGASQGNRTNPLASFYLGGFGNNYVDARAVKRYREYYAFPGFGINEIAGRSFVRQMVEWNAPPVIFESVGVPALHLSWVRPALFASALWTDPEHASRRRDYANAGVQLDLHLSVMHWYESTLSFGYAVGFSGGRHTASEWMVSLKLL